MYHPIFSFTMMARLFTEIASEIFGINVLDAQKAMQVATEAGKDESFVAHALKEHVETHYNDVKIKDIYGVDIVLAVYHALLLEVRDEIIDLFNIDIFDTDIYISANYLATSFDNCDGLIALLSHTIMNAKDKEKLLAKLAMSSPVLKWFFDEIDFNYKSME